MTHIHMPIFTVAMVMAIQNGTKEISSSISILHKGYNSF